MAFHFWCMFFWCMFHVLLLEHCFPKGNKRCFFNRTKKKLITKMVGNCKVFWKQFMNSIQRLCPPSLKKIFIWNYFLFTHKTKQNSFKTSIREQKIFLSKNYDNIKFSNLSGYCYNASITMDMESLAILFTEDTLLFDFFVFCFLILAFQYENGRVHTS